MEWIVEAESLSDFVDHGRYTIHTNPVIRCKDCKHRIEHEHYGDLGESAYTCEGNMGGWILPDDFCSMAERKTDGN